MMDVDDPGNDAGVCRAPREAAPRRGAGEAPGPFLRPPPVRRTTGARSPDGHHDFGLVPLAAELAYDVLKVVTPGVEGLVGLVVQGQQIEEDVRLAAVVAAVKPEEHTFQPQRLALGLHAPRLRPRQ